MGRERVCRCSSAAALTSAKGVLTRKHGTFNYGAPFTETEEDTIVRGLEPWFIRGLSLLGGEPFEPSNQQALLPLLRKVRKSYPEKTIWCYTGYDFEQDLLTGRLCDWPVTEEMLSYIRRFSRRRI